MTSFNWERAFDLGHEEIDGQHRRMFLLADAAVNSQSTSGVNKVALDTERLQDLVDFTHEHFAFEERLMRSNGYPDTEAHAKYHASLLSELRMYCNRAQRGQITNTAGLVLFLWNWLHIHIDAVDRDLVLWLSQLQRQRTNGAG